MKKLPLFIIILLFALNFLIIKQYFNQPPIPIIDQSENLPGGETSVSIFPFASLMLPAKNLPANKMTNFHAGKALAHQPWIKAPTTTDARDGLGPIYNARTCLFCHINGGRGNMPKNNKQLLFANFLRLSLPGENLIDGVIPEPMYGDQLQTQSVALMHQLGLSKTTIDDEIPAEGYIYVDWIKETFTYPDGSKVELRKPQIIITNLGYGPLHPNTLMGIRNPPPIHGVGLIELIKQQDIDMLVDEHDNNKDGISGRLNQVWDYDQKKTVPGRFGLKANKANVKLQVAAALHGDMGIKNSVFPTQPCTQKQTKCLQTIHGDNEQGLEITDSLLDLMVDFNSNIGVPKRRKPNHPMILKGRGLFYQTGCQHCHNPSYTTAKSKKYPHLGNQKIWPYSDFLLHDMGENLSDNRPDYLAKGNEWRTPPLWSVGLGRAVNQSKDLLHDGRAQSLEEAVLWHGGEAENIKNTFTYLDKKDREALLAFVRSL